MVATQIRTRLAECGHRSVFLDFDPADGIPAGRDWEKELYAQLQDCRAVIVLCSQGSVESRWCFAEITPRRFHSDASARSKTHQSVAALASHGTRRGHSHGNLTLGTAGRSDFDINIDGMAHTTRCGSIYCRILEMLQYSRRICPRSTAQRTTISACESGVRLNDCLLPNDAMRHPSESVLR